MGKNQQQVHQSNNQNHIASSDMGQYENDHGQNI